MAVHTSAELLDHYGHEVEVAKYGDPPVNVAIECMTCMTVLVDFEHSTCAACGAPMEMLVRAHHHTENGKDVTR